MFYTQHYLNYDAGYSKYTGNSVYKCNDTHEETHIVALKCNAVLWFWIENHNGSRSLFDRVHKTDGR